MAVLGTGIVLGLIGCFVLHRMNKKTDILLRQLKRRNEREYRRLLRNDPDDSQTA